MKILFSALIVLLIYTNYCKAQEPYNWSYLTDLDPERINLCSGTDSNDIFVIGGWNGTDGGIGSIVKYNFTKNIIQKVIDILWHEDLIAISTVLQI
jgi:hypothetical protein